MLRVSVLAARLVCIVGVGSSTAAPKLLPFQGRLTTASGSTIQDGNKLVQFKIYDAPVGGSVVWNGEVHNLTVNGGTVNTILGSRSALDGVDFNNVLYLGITIDANNDSQITSADPPLLPRQSILPVVFAREAAEARNSSRLAGHDWSDILVSGNDPRTGQIRGSKIEDESIQTRQIGPSSVTTTQIAQNAIVTSNILDGAVTASKIASGSVGPVQLADASITSGKLGAKVVQSSHIASASVGADNLAANSVTAAKIATDAVSPVKLAAGMFLTRRYSWVNSNHSFPEFNTGMSSSAWYPVLTGVAFGTADINEDDTGSLGGIWFVESSGTWRIRAGIRSHNNTPDPEVTVLWIPRRLVSGP